MPTIRLYRHPDCARCAALSRMHERMDWLGRFESSTEPVPDGPPLKIGEIAVQDLRTGVTLRGIACIRLLCRQIPAYLPLLPLTHLAPIRRRIEHDIGGCTDGACDLPPARPA